MLDVCHADRRTAPESVEVRQFSGKEDWGTASATTWSPAGTYGRRQSELKLAKLYARELLRASLLFI
jgi:hypothetical protein